MNCLNFSRDFNRTTNIYFVCSLILIVIKSDQREKSNGEKEDKSLGFFEIQSKLHLLVLIWAKLLKCRFDLQWRSPVLKKRLLYKNVGQTAEFAQWTSFKNLAQKLTVAFMQSVISIEFLLNIWNLQTKMVKSQTMFWSLWWYKDWFIKNRTKVST